MKILFIVLIAITFVAVSTDVKSADTNTVSSTVVTNSTPPTANAPSVVVNNSDVCKTAESSAIQTQIDTKFDSGDDIVLAKHDAWVQATGVKVGNSGIVMDSVTIKTLQSSSESFADNDTSLMTSAAVADKIEAYGYTTNAGDITAVVAGSGMSGGATDGSATVTLDLNELGEVQIANGDFIPFIDATDSNAGKKESLADIATLFSGTNLTATN